MNKTVVLTGTALVSFKKVMHDMSPEEIEEMSSDHESLALQIDSEDILDIQSVEHISLEHPVD